MSRQPPREFVPPVQRFRIRYAKRGRLRFASHRDFQRAFERALRRAEVPMAYSAGFTPHPKISYANAAPTGTASEAEYVEIGVAAACEADDLRTRIDAALPEGFDVLEVVQARTPDFAHRLQASRWRIELPEVTVEDAQRALAELWATSTAPVERLMKDGRRTIDVRPALLSAAVAPGRPGESACAILTVVVQAVTPSVRPDDILAALRSVAGLITPVPAQVTREMQGPVGVADSAAQVAEGFPLGDPLAADREADQT